MSSSNFLALQPIKNKPIPEKIEITRSASLVSISSTSTVNTTRGMESANKVEEKVANFVGKEAALICSHNFARDHHALQLLIKGDSLILADELCNQKTQDSIQETGVRVEYFRHNDVKYLKRLLKDALTGVRRDANMRPILKRDARGMALSRKQLLNGRKPPKTFVIVEGVYFWQGDLCSLREIVELKGEFDFELFVDESHSLGILGQGGSGLCQELGIDPTHIDLLMGSFQTPFGMPGGFVAGSKKMIDAFRVQVNTEQEGKIDANARFEAEHSDSALPPPELLQQLGDRLELVAGEEGIEKREALSASSKHIHRRLKAMGFLLFDSEQSPITTFYVPDHMQGIEFLRAVSQSARYLSIQLVDPPRQKPARIRFYLSSNINGEQVERFLESCDEFGDKFGLKVNKRAESLEPEKDDDDAAIDREQEMQKIDSLDIERMAGGKDKKDGIAKRLRKRIGNWAKSLTMGKW